MASIYDHWTDRAALCSRGLRISEDIRDRLPVCTDPHGALSGLERITRELGLRSDRDSDVREEIGSVSE